MKEPAKFKYLILSVACALFLHGCSTAPVRHVESRRSVVKDTDPGPLPKPSLFSLQSPSQGIFAEDWMEVFIDGKKAGYAVSRLMREGDIIKTSDELSMVVRRDGAPLEVHHTVQTTETLDGEPLAMYSRHRQGGAVSTLQMQVQGDQMHVTFGRGDNKKTLTSQPQQPFVLTWGLIRSLADTQWTAGKRLSHRVYNHEVDLLDSTQIILTPHEHSKHYHYDQQIVARPIDMTVGQGEYPQRHVLWMDTQNRIIQTIHKLLGTDHKRMLTTKEKALQGFQPPEIYTVHNIPIDQFIPAIAESVTYRLKRTDGGKLSLNWPESMIQSVRSMSDYEVDVTVLFEDREKLPISPTPIDASSFLQSGDLINAEDPLIQDLAKQAIGSHVQTDLNKAEKLRAFVNDYVNGNEMGVSFATASEVARNPRGDCTEHSVLLAAMGRALGIPSRVATGLIYVPAGEGNPNRMGFHMWTQFYIDGHWLNFDALNTSSETLPVRILLQTSALGDIETDDYGLSVLNAVGKLAITVQDIEMAAANL